MSGESRLARAAATKGIRIKSALREGVRALSRPGAAISRKISIPGTSVSIGPYKPPEESLMEVGRAAVDAIGGRKAMVKKIEKIKVRHSGTPKRNSPKAKR